MAWELDGVRSREGGGAMPGVVGGFNEVTIMLWVWPGGGGNRWRVVGEEVKYAELLNHFPMLPRK